VCFESKRRASTWALRLLPLVLGLAGCGLSDYEKLMVEAQKRAQRFDEETRSLGEPISVPKRSEKGQEVPLANVFFRPPKGISKNPEGTPRGELLYSYMPVPGGAARDFTRVEMAFASDSKDFANDVTRNFQATEAVTPRTQQVQPPGRPPLTFQVLEFDDPQFSYSVNIYQRNQTQVAIVFQLVKGRREAARKVIDLSLSSLAVDDEAGLARQEYNRGSPWKLKAAPTP
jgi:hypothetical protein